MAVFITVQALELPRIHSGGRPPLRAWPRPSSQ